MIKKFGIEDIECPICLDKMKQDFIGKKHKTLEEFGYEFVSDNSVSINYRVIGKRYPDYKPEWISVSFYKGSKTISFYKYEPEWTAELLNAVLLKYKELGWI